MGHSRACLVAPRGARCACARCACAAVGGGAPARRTVGHRAPWVSLPRPSVCGHLVCRQSSRLGRPPCRVAARAVAWRQQQARASARVAARHPPCTTARPPGRPGVKGSQQAPETQRQKTLTRSTLVMICNETRTQVCMCICAASAGLRGGCAGGSAAAIRAALVGRGGRRAVKWRKSLEGSQRKSPKHHSRAAVPVPAAREPSCRKTFGSQQQGALRQARGGRSGVECALA